MSKELGAGVTVRGEKKEIIEGRLNICIICGSNKGGKKNLPQRMAKSVLRSTLNRLYLINSKAVV